MGEAFTDGRDERAWLEHLYDGLARRLARHGIDAPSFEAIAGVARVMKAASQEG